MRRVRKRRDEYFDMTYLNPGDLLNVCSCLCRPKNEMMGVLLESLHGQRKLSMFLLIYVLQLMYVHVHVIGKDVSI